MGEVSGTPSVPAESTAPQRRIFLVVVDDTMRTMIHDGAGEHELERHARTLTPSIRDDGRSKVLKGETTIEEVLRVTEKGVFVQGLNLVKRHTKPNPQANQPGGIVEREAPVHQSNVALLNSATGKGERVSFKTLEGGRKVRVFRKSGEVVDV